MKTRIGVGIIGTGFARRTQIPAFSAIDEVELVSISSGQESNARSVAKDFGFGHHSGDWTETSDHPDVDLVCITTPPDLHLPMTLRSLEHGKHVLCEKPMAMNVREAQRMADAARDSGRLALIDHELRFTNGRMLARRKIREGEIGRIRHVKYLFRNSARGDATLPWTWWSDKEKGGGALGAIVSHSIDSIRWFLDVEVTSVSCRLHTHIEKRHYGNEIKAVTSDDEALVICGLGKSDLVENASASISASLVEAGPYRNRIEFYGTKGALRIEDGGETYTAGMGNEEWAPIDLELGGTAPGMESGGWSRGFTTFSRLIIEALLQGQTDVKDAATFEDGVAIQKVLDACRESNAGSRSVKLES